MKKVIGLILTVIMLFGSTTTAFAAPTQTAVNKKADFQRQINAVAAKYGGKVVILDNVDPSTIKLKFDTIEEFDKAIGTLQVVNLPTQSTNATEPQINSTAPVTENESMSLALTSTYTGTWTGDHLVMLGGENLAYLRQKVIATEYWDSFYQRNLFSTVDSHTSYISQGFVTTWTPEYYTHPFIDGRRTIEATSYGHMTLGIVVGNYTIGYTWDMQITDWFYAV